MFVIFGNEISSCTTKGVARNFSRGGLSGAPGEGSPAIFQFPGGAQPRFLVASMVKMKEFSGQGGGHGPPLPMPAYALVYNPNDIHVSLINFMNLVILAKSTKESTGNTQSILRERHQSGPTRLKRNRLRCLNNRSTMFHSGSDIDLVF